MRNVPRALASIPGGAQILVVDAESSDATVALARSRGAEVIVRPWAGFVSTRSFALSRVRTPWTFMLDADEALDEVLAEALRALAPAAEVDGYRIARTTYFCGRPMHYGAWGGETPLRLFRSTRATLVAEPVARGNAELHERWIVPGAVACLHGTLLHDSYPTMRTYREKFSRYTRLEALGLVPSQGAFIRALALASFRAPWLLLGKGGWRDGWRGVFVTLASASYPVVVAWKALRV